METRSPFETPRAVSHRATRFERSSHWRNVIASRASRSSYAFSLECASAMKRSWSTRSGPVGGTLLLSETHSGHLAASSAEELVLPGDELLGVPPAAAL